MTATEDPKAKKRTGRRPVGLPSGRDVLLRAALRHFGLHSYHGVSLRALARDAGVDMALFSRLFGSKAGPWLAMLEELEANRIARFDARLHALGDRAGPVEARVGEMIDLLIEMANDVTDLLRLLLQDFSDGGDRIANAVDKLILPVRDQMVRLLAEAMAAGYVRGRDPEVMFLVFSSAIAVPFGAKVFVDAALSQPPDALPARLRETILAILTVENWSPRHPRQ
jgi:AcrR family transcriptional regulator